MTKAVENMVKAMEKKANALVDKTPMAYGNGGVDDARAIAAKVFPSWVDYTVHAVTGHKPRIYVASFLPPFMEKKVG